MAKSRKRKKGRNHQPPRSLKNAKEVKNSLSPPDLDFGTDNSSIIARRREEEEEQSNEITKADGFEVKEPDSEKATTAPQSAPFQTEEDVSSDTNPMQRIIDLEAQKEFSKNLTRTAQGEEETPPELGFSPDP